MATEDLLMAYIGLRSTQDKAGYIGGMLVIDARGIPRESRFTLPIRPTAVQKALYGNALGPHIAVDLIELQLVENLTSSPFCCVAEHRMLLPLREHVEMPVVHIEPYGDASSTDRGSDETYRVDNGTSVDRAVAVRSAQTADLETVQETFDHTFNRIDLLEPFDCISTAIEALSESDPQFR